MTLDQRIRLRSWALIVAVVGVVMTACGSAGGAEATEEPVAIEATNDAEIWRLTLTESAARRLDVQTATVGSAGDRLVVPSAAVIIDPAGVYWVYTNPQPLVYVREEIRPVHEEGHLAFFDEGPPLGMAVVTTGVPELYGAEFGIGK